MILILSILSLLLTVCALIFLFVTMPWFTRHDDGRNKQDIAEQAVFILTVIKYMLAWFFVMNVIIVVEIIRTLMMY